jgi:hypothetical protein
MVPPAEGFKEQAASAPVFWQLLAGHGVQDIASAAAIAERMH